jgi:hypothetical protein
MAARESRPLAPSPDESWEKGLPQVRVRGGDMSLPHPSGADERRVGDVFRCILP